MDWDGMLPFATNPQVYNPRQGFIANWNNQPMRGYPSTDLFAIVWGQADRYAEIETRLKAMTANGGKLCRRQSPPLPAVPATRGGGVAGRRRPRETGCGAAIVGRDERQR
ncbi:hypothetical protein G6F65_022147 [Rhizopus arrhizus]|nr:hypothetical protein G6F65_022147 [Rhizopus arrhizus]